MDWKDIKSHKIYKKRRNKYCLFTYLAIILYSKSHSVILVTGETYDNKINRTNFLKQNMSVETKDTAENNEIDNNDMFIEADDLDAKFSMIWNK